ncbi:MAG TPA: exodeoxyribonuclease VII large subunit [Chthoniobacterales bacterium]|jgi:exodeoxyribonuclease VII large subunit
MNPDADFFPNVAKVLTVAELTRSIRGLLETRFGAVWVQGEISNYKKHPSGHQYFTLKDQRAAISCVIFRNTLPPFPTALSDGMQVQVYGNVTVFEARGQYQLSVQILQSRGLGILQAKFEALKRKLEAEGLFEAARKRPLPKFPRRIGIITSPSGAAIQDMLNILRRRAPGVHVLINPVRVQGTGAAAEIATAIRELSAPNECWEALDVLVVARGGGSIEDLWEFNEEIVARAIFHATIPVVSAVGHEVDFTIADFVADLRAPTPSAAAELIVPDVRGLERRVAELRNCLEKCWRSFLAQARGQLSAVSEKTLFRELSRRLRETQQQLDFARETLQRSLERRRLAERNRLTTAELALKAHNPGRELAARRQRLQELQRRLGERVTQRLTIARERWERSAGMLRLLGPEGTLGRGYSITRDGEGNLIRSVAAVRPGMALRTRVSDGEFDSEVPPVG